MYPEAMAGLADFVGTCTHNSTWRTSAHSEESKMTPEQVELAELFEDVIQVPRYLILLKYL